jgi:Holliday junction resolvase RusA-like endonuclease
MTEDLWFVLDVNPEPWAIGPVGYRRSGGKMSAYVGQNQQLNAYKEAIKESIGKQDMLTGKVSITFFFWRNRAEYTTPQSRSHRKHEADATNMQKATEDALQGILYGNDKDNMHVESYVVEQGPDVEGKVVIRARSGDGAFDPNIIPDHIWDRIDGLKPQPRLDDDNPWGGKNDDIF